MDQDTRNKLQRATQQVRRILEEEFAEQLEGTFDVLADGTIAEQPGAHLDATQRLIRQKLVQAIGHLESSGKSTKDAIEEYLRQAAFTILNRFVALRMLEARDLLQECVSKGDDSSGFKEFCGLAPGLSGLPDDGYRLYLECLCDELTVEIKVLFDRRDLTTLLWPRRSALTAMLDVLAQPDLANVWTEDETIGWVYQYFNGDEERTKMRAESQAPRNSRELAVRNQFFTPRYVVQFLTDNTLGRTWYEMMQGDTQLAHLDYLVRRPDEVFLAPSTSEGHQNFDGDCATIVRQLQSGNAESFPGFSAETENQIQRMIQLAHCVSAYDQLGERAMEWFETIRNLTERDTESLLTRNTGEILNYLFMTCRADRHGGDGTVYAEPWVAAAANEVRRRSLQQDDDSQEQLLKRPVYIPHRAKKDPRDLRILDPACGSGHFLLYTFDLLITIYEEAWGDARAAIFTETGSQLRADYASLDDLRCVMPALILRHNLYGVDIDPRAAQIAALALWMRAQRAYNQFELDRALRPAITKTNIVVAEPMPGGAALVDEFAASLKPAVLGDLFKKMVEEMKLAGALGSLLRIEESIAQAVNEAEKVHQKEGLFAEKIESQGFWDTADEKIIAALGSFAESAAGAGGVRRQLFAGDAAQGVAFIELIRKRFDAVLMNPPFGRFVPRFSDIIDTNYGRGNVDLYAAFVQRAGQLLVKNGQLGALTSRTYITQSAFKHWRLSFLIKQMNPRVILDLGEGVLDDANVRVAALVATAGGAPNTTHGTAAMFIDLKTSAAKAAHSLEIKQQLAEGDAPPLVYEHDISSFLALKGAPFIYSVPHALLALASRKQTLSNVGFQARQGFGASTRFHRLAWEPKASDIGIGRQWLWLAHGTPPRPFYKPTYFVVRWEAEGREAKADVVTRYPYLNGNYAFKIQSESYYGKPGFGYGKRTGHFTCQLLPEAHAFSHEGTAIHSSLNSIGQTFGALAILNSSVAAFWLNQACADHKDYTYLNSLPFPDNWPEELGELARRGIGLAFHRAATDEVSNWFAYPALLTVSGATLKERYLRVQELSVEAESEMSQLLSTIDEVCFGIYRISPNEQTEILKQLGEHPAMNARPDINLKSCAVGLLSWAVGVVFGRFDVRPVCLPAWDADPFQPPPACQPARLAHRGLELEAAPDDYPLSFPANGVLVDDLGANNDLCIRLRSALTVVFGAAAEDWIAETEQALSSRAQEFRSWVRSDFFGLHIKQYSKSRRKAPIYWQLATLSASYSVWLYYHRFTRDTFFQVLNDYVNPKLDHERQKLERLRSEAGAEPTRSQRTEIEGKENFVAELASMAEEVARIAPLWNPNLNDGVIINFAPLWRLVPQNKSWQKECKKCWDELVKGEYDWAHLAMHLWPERVVAKCVVDASLAIAHGLEEVFWEQDERDRFHPKEEPAGGWEPVVEDLVAERTSPAVKAALESLLTAPAPAGNSKSKSRRRKATT